MSWRTYILYLAAKQYNFCQVSFPSQHTIHLRADLRNTCMYVFRMRGWTENSSGSQKKKRKKKQKINSTGLWRLVLTSILYKSCATILFFCVHFMKFSVGVFFSFSDLCFVFVSSPSFTPPREDLYTRWTHRICSLYSTRCESFE